MKAVINRDQKNVPMKVQLSVTVLFLVMRFRMYQKIIVIMKFLEEAQMKVKDDGPIRWISDV